MDAAARAEIAATPVRDWVVNHDDSRAFVVLYVLLALVLSIGVGLFWLVALVGVHLAFEYVRARHHGSAPRTALVEALWALRLDVALVFFALVLALYLKFVFGVLGLQAAGRAAAAAQTAARGGARFAAWERVVHGVLITMDDMARGVRAVAMLRSAGPGAGAAPVAAAIPAAPVPARRMGTGDRLTLAFGAACLLLIVLAPWLGYGSWGETLAVLGAELRPFPGRGG